MILLEIASLKIHILIPLLGDGFILISLADKPGLTLEIRFIFETFYILFYVIS